MANQNFKVKKGLEVGTGVTISGTDGNINISGIITASQFSGDGSALTGVTAAGSGVVVQEEGSNIGTAATINFIGSNVTAALSGGIANVTVSAGGLSNVVEDTTPQLGGNLDLNSKDITGTGNISITGGFNATGVSTFQENVVFQSTASFGDNDKINAGAGNDLQIYHNGTNSFIDNTTGSLLIRGANGNHVRIQSPSGEESIVAAANGSVDLYYDNSKKLETTNTGVTVTGTLAATAVTGDGSGLTGLPAAGISDVVADTTPQLGGNLDANSKDITGIANLNVAGVSTFQGNVNLGDSDKAIFGAGQDLQIYHNGTDSIIADVGEGNLNILGDADVAIINAASTEYKARFTSDGAAELYYNGAKKLETTNTGVTVTGTLAATAVTGSGSGLTGLTGASAGTYGSSSAVPIITVDSNGRITGVSTTGVSGGGGGGGIDNIVQDTTPQLGGDLDLNGNDITGTGNITITSADAGSSAGPEFKLHRNSASPADADYLGQIKFAGESDTGVERNYAKITGKISDASNGTEDGIIEIAHIKAGSQNISARWKSDELQFLNGTNVSWADNLKATFGNSDDLQIYHDESNSYISDSGTGGLKITGSDIYIRNTSDQDMIHASSGSFVKLYHNNALRLQTNQTGVSITDDLNVAGVSTFQSHVHLGDNDQLRFGADNDLKIYHSSSGSFIDNTGNVTLALRQFTNDADIVLSTDDGSGGVTPYIRCDGSNGEVQLGHYGTTKFATKSTGIEVTGAVTATTIVKSGGSSSQYLMADGSVSTTVGISTAFSNVQATWSVNSSGSSSYRFTGPGNDGTDDNPDLYLVRGQRYRFTNNSGGSHPFQIRSSPGGSAYSTGVTNNGAASGNIDFNVQHDAPARLYYQCTAHSGMVGNIYIVGGSDWRMTDVNTSTAPEIYTTRSVGIGTDNPLNGLDILQSDGRTRITAFGHIITQNHNNSTTNYWSIAPRNSGELDIGYGAADGNGTVDADKVTITTAGLVGIGTANPGRKVEIFDTAATVLQLNSTSTNGTSLRIQNSGTDKMYMGLAGDFIVGQGSNVTDSAIRASGSLLFASGGGTERLRITSGGDVSIGGLSSPRAKLDIEDAGTGQDVILRVSADDNNPYGLVVANDSFNTTSNRGLAFWVGANKVHHISARTSTTGSENALSITAGADIYFTTGGAERLRIDSTGIIKTPNLQGNNHREIHRKIDGFNSGSSVVNYLLICETDRTNVRLAGRLFTARASGTSATSAQIFDITFQQNHNATHRSGAIMGLHSGSNNYGHAEAEFVSLTYNSTNYYAIRFSAGWVTDFDTCSFDGIREHTGTELFTHIDSTNDTITNVSVLTDATNKGDVTIQQADLRISDGDIIMPSGHGISFSANANASGATSEVLNDYEEGTFTATCANSVTLDSSVNLCQYVKIGSSVTVMGQIRVSNSNSNSALVINNLPFSVYSSGEGSSFATGAVRLYNSDMADDHKYVICLADGGSTNLQFQGVRDSAASQGLGATNNGYYMFSTTYRTSS